MTLPGYRHRILILDRSGSIASVLGGQQSGLEEFFASEAKVKGKATYSLWEFDEQVDYVHSFAPLAKVRKHKIVPRNMTALYDAIWTAVETEGVILSKMPEEERPEDVTAIISSDGLNNAWGQARSGDDVKKLLARQQDVYKWRVLYMGCNQDAMYEGEKIGTRGGMTVNTVSTDSGSFRGWKMSADYLSRVPVASAASGQSVFFTPEERALGESGETPENPED